jgi:hypothetical protein
LANPGYRRNKRPEAKSVLQEPLITQAVENKEVTRPDVSSVLQDICLVQPALVVGLISIMTGSGLQEDIVASARWYINRGEDILRMVPGKSAFPSVTSSSSSATKAWKPPPFTPRRASPS